jgi:hypothetical protein
VGRRFQERGREGGEEARQSPQQLEKPDLRAVGTRPSAKPSPYGLRDCGPTTSGEKVTEAPTARAKQRTSETGPVWLEPRNPATVGANDMPILFVTPSHGSSAPSALEDRETPILTERGALRPPQPRNQRTRSCLLPDTSRSLQPSPQKMLLFLSVSEIFLPRFRIFSCSFCFEACSSCTTTPHKGNDPPEDKSVRPWCRSQERMMTGHPWSRHCRAQA